VNREQWLRFMQNFITIINVINCYNVNRGMKCGLQNVMTE